VLVDAGAVTVFAAARNARSLSPLKARYDSRLEYLELDITNSLQIAAAASKAKVSLLINNAGVLDYSGPLATMGPSWRGTSRPISAGHLP
jgi:NADP-dependent 3-hydroxy acid dehydrogenase YdfG